MKKKIISKGANYRIKIIPFSGYSTTSKYKLRVKLYNLYDAKFFTCDAADPSKEIDTRETASLSIPYLWNMGWTAGEYLHNSASAAYTVLPTTDIFVSHNHGSPGYQLFDKSDGTKTYLYANKTIDTKEVNRALSDFSSGQLSEVDLIMFVGCNLGVTDSTYGNLVDMAYDKGAYCSVGWLNFLYDDVMNYWVSKFFEKCKAEQNNTRREGIMKNKKLLVIFISVLIIAITVSVASFALINTGVLDSVKINNKSNRADATQTKAISLSDGTKQQLTYKETQTYTTDNYVDIYVDNKQNQYRFDKKDNLIGFINNNSDDKLESQIIADKSLDSAVSNGDAINIATKYAKKLYGSIFDEFEYTNSVFSEYSDSYNIQYNITAGKDGYISVATCNVNVYLNGSVASCNMPIWYDKNDIDFKKLNNISKDELEEFADNKAKELYGDEYVYSFIDNNVEIFLTQENAKTVIAVPTIVTLKDDNGVSYNVGKELHYELS